MTGRRWTATECADHLGITEARWRSYLTDANRARAAGKSHWLPLPLGHDPATGLMVWDADAVRRGHASRPGRGARTDLKERSAPDA